MGLFGQQVQTLVQRERDLLPDVRRPLNKFLVSRNCTGSKVAILRPPPEMISRADALLLAAFLVEAADGSPSFDAFKSMLISVQNAPAM